MNNKEKIAALVELRGQHDQTVRCMAIALLIDGMGYPGTNDTDKFLSYCIGAIESRDVPPDRFLWKPNPESEGD
jgi:hypothetical protein